MVHINDFGGGYFTFTENVRELHFHGQAVNPLAPVTKDLFDNYAVLQNNNFKKAEKAVQRWETKLKKLLSVPVGKYAHKRRPGQRKYPMMNDSGALRNSVKVNLSRSVHNKRWEYTFTGVAAGSGNGSSDHADVTNAARGSAHRSVQWKNWFDEAFNMGHSKSLVGARVLMSNIFRNI